METAGQLAQAGLGLTFEALLLAPILLEGQTDLLEEVWGQGEDIGFSLTAEGEGGRAMGFATGAVAGGFATAATERNQRAAQKEGLSGG